MLGLGSSIVKGGVGAKTIVTDNLVLKHDYNVGQVHQVSTGAADINSDADANEYINVGTITIGTGDISVSAWVYITDFATGGTYGGIITNRQTASTSPGIQLRVRENDTIEMLIDDGGSDSTIASGALNTHQWYHVCGVWDRSDKQFLYIDGVLVNSGDITNENLTLNHSDDVYIGRLDTTGYDFMGYICNVGYWNDRALSQAEVKSIMWKNYSLLTSDEKEDLVSWWNLDSVIDSTDTVGHGDTTVYDNHHGGGDTLGSELVPTSYILGSSNGEWSAYNPSGTTGLATDGNILTVTLSGAGGGVASGAKMEISSSITAGKTYKVQADVWLGTETGTSGFSFYLGGVARSISSISSTQTTYTTYITTTGTGDLLVYQTNVGSATGTFFVSNVSVKLVNGNTGTLL